MAKIYIYKLSSTEIRVTFIDYGEDVERFFGKDEIETTLNIYGEKAKKLYWKLIGLKYFSIFNPTIKEVKDMCEELGLGYTTFTW